MPAAPASAPDEKGQHDNALDVDPHHRRGLPILCRGAHRLAKCGVADEQVQSHHQRHGHAHQKDIFGGEQHLGFEAHEIAQDVDGREDIGVADLTGPFQFWAILVSTNEAPTAVISGARRGARRNGL